jgi:hypothetical protein
MKRLAIAVALVSTIAATPAAAQSTRSFVSGHGSDSNSCTLTAPCRTFAAAYAMTNAGGEITVLDPAGYGPLTINKSISIINDGVGEAGIATTVAGSVAVTIDAGANDTVLLRGLTLTGPGSGAGVRFQTGKKLTVQNCVVRSFLDGIEINSYGLSNATMSLVVSDSTVSDNANEGIGIQVNGASNTITGVFSGLRAINNGDAGVLINGANTTGAVNVTVSDSLLSNNSVGVGSESGSGEAPTAIVVARSTVSNNGVGLFADGVGATLDIGGSVVAANTTHGWQEVSSGSIGSYGDNYIEHNGANVGGLSVLSRQ